MALVIFNFILDFGLYNPFYNCLGIPRNSTYCNWKASWQLYGCCGIVHRMLIIDSLDADSNTRRVSPVSIVCDGYLNFANGPMKKGWGERKSIFAMIVPVGEFKFSDLSTICPILCCKFL